MKGRVTHLKLTWSASCTSFGDQFGNYYQSSKSLNPLSQSFHFQKLSQGHKHRSQNVFTRIFTAPLTVNQMSKRGQNESTVVHPLPQAVAFPGCHSPPHFSVFFTKSESTLAFSVIWSESGETEGKSSGDSWEMYSSLTKQRGEEKQPSLFLDEILWREDGSYSTAAIISMRQV